MRRFFASVLLCLIVAGGCALDKSESGPPRDDKPTPSVTSDVTLAIKAARGESNRFYRESLTRIADDVEAGRIVYDTKLQLELTQASRDAGAPIAAVLQSKLPTGKITDPKAVAGVLRQIRDGYQ